MAKEKHQGRVLNATYWFKMGTGSSDGFFFSFQTAFLLLPRALKPVIFHPLESRLQYLTLLDMGTFLWISNQSYDILTFK